MSNAVQFGKIGLPIKYNTLPTATSNLTGVIGIANNKYYKCNGTSWEEIVSPSGTLEIISNGEKDVTNYAKANVNIPSPTLDGNAEASNVLSGKTFYSNSTTKQTGTMPNIGQEHGIINNTTSPRYNIAKGYHDGTGFVEINASQIVDCVAANILQGKTILGVQGTLVKGITPSGTLDITTNGTKDVTNYASVNVNVPLPTLNAPTISLSNSTVTITNPVTNGSFVSGYDVYKNGILLTSITLATVDLSTLITDSGTYTITVKAKGTNFNESVASNSVEYTVSSGFTVSVNNFKYRSDSVAAKIYDGQNNTGTLVATINAGDTVNVNISSGYLFAEYNTYVDMNYSQGTTSGGVTFENYNFGNPASLLYKVTGNGSITGMYMYICFVEGTLITLADGSQKKVEDINYNDKVLTYDFDKGEFTQGDIFWIAKENVATEYWKITLSDGTELKLVGSNGKSHRLFSVDNSKFLYPQDFTGKVFKENKETPAIVSCKKVNEEVKYYNFLNTHLNCFANGTMAGCRFSNIYPIENMKYVKNEIRTNYLESFKDIPQKYIDGLRLKEQPLEKDESNVNYYDTVKEHIMNIYMRLERKE